MRLDHVAVAAESLAAGVAHVEAALGVPLGPGGAHPAMGTHNRLLGLGDSYLEVIAIDPAAPPPARARWFGLDGFRGRPRPAAWVARTDTLDATLADLPEAGRPVALSRGDLRWRMAVPDAGALPFDGLFPALIEWQGAAPALPDSGLRLLRVEIAHPDADRLAARLRPRIPDARLAFRAEPRPALRLVISTPTGERTLA